MKLILLGTTGYHPSDQRQTACLMLPEIGVVLDAGTGFYRVREHLQTPTLDIFLTHAHLDHCIGLTYLFDVLWERPVDRVRVFGRRENLAEIDAHLFSTALFPIRPPFDYAPLDEAADNAVDLAEQGRLTWFPLEHPGGSLGYRLDWSGRSLAYVTDTTAHGGAPYIDRIRGVDALVHECNFPDGWEAHAQKTGHSCLTPVVELARDAAVGRLILVHVNPLADQRRPLDLAAAQRIFPATEIGEDGMEIDF